MTENIPGLKFILDMLTGPCYLSRDDQDGKIRARKNQILLNTPF